MALEGIQHIVIVLLENRSFDHMLGYLNLADANPRLELEGLQDDPTWIAAHANELNGHTYSPRLLGPNIQRIEPDAPHDLADIAVQIGTPAHDPKLTQMGGFVKSYAKVGPPDPSLVMGHYKKDAVPCYDFFARNFLICDHWFSCLPTGTQANRLMAMAGESAIPDNVPNTLPDQKLVYDWLDEQKVDWCAYQWKSFPFFFLMRRWRIEMLLSLSNPENSGRFRAYESFDQQWKGDRSLPSVIFIEPKYTNDPLPYDPNDDHSPTGVAKGQEFVRQIYGTLTSNKDRWKNTMMIVTYDEHGGFFDHVPPLLVPNRSGGHAFRWTGPRVPAFVVSPHVPSGKVFSDPLDHTSILALLAEKFAATKQFSPAVTARQQHLSKLSAVLTETPGPNPRTPEMSAAPQQDHLLVASSGNYLDDATAKAFHQAAMDAAKQRPDLLNNPKWSALAHYVARHNADAAIEWQSGPVG